MKRKERNVKQAHIYYNEREFNQLDELQRLSENLVLVAPSKAEIFRIALDFLYTENKKDPETLKRVLKADRRED